MPIISTRAHGVLDYAGGAALLLAPGPLRVSDARALAVLRGTGAGMLASSALTDYELGVRRILPMPVHLIADAAIGALMVSSPWTLRRRGSRIPGRGGGSLTSWVPHVLVGVGAIAGAALTERRPADAAQSMDTNSYGGATTPQAVVAQPPAAPSHGTTTGPAARVAPGESGVQIAPAPVEAPGPSVTPPLTPESDTERAEWADSARPDADAPQARREDDLLVAQEEAAAAAEAAAIGGRVTHDSEDPALDPVLQAGGGEEEGFEAAEADLIENATHADGGGNPLRDALSPEAEADRAGAVYGEADEIPVTEVVEDPQEGPDDPGAGPGIAADR